jgi:hypothetical protein
MPVNPEFMKRMLEPGEIVAAVRKLHWIYLLSGFTWLLILSGFGWGVALALWRYLPLEYLQYDVDLPHWHAVVKPSTLAWLFTAAGAMIFFTQYVSYRAINVVLTSRRLIYRAGFIHIRVDETDISEIKAVHVDQGWLGWLLGSGGINCDCRFVADVSIPFMPRPYEFVKNIHGMRSRARAEEGGDPVMGDAAVRAAAIRVLPVYMMGPQSGGAVVESEAHLLPDDNAARRELARRMLQSFRKKS